MRNKLNELYHHYLKGRLNAEEYTEFRSLVDGSTDEELWQLLTDSDKDTGLSSPMLQISKHRIRSKLNRMIMKQYVGRTLRYAAAVALLVGCVATGWLMRPMPQPDLTLTASVRPGNKSDIVLPDGTKVFLNGATSLSCDMSNPHERLVSLTGEAYFEVAKNPDAPFRVRVGGVVVEALGTAFNIRTSKDGMVETSLLEGKVRITADESDREVLLTPGEKACYNSADKAFLISYADRHVETGWIDDYLIFESESLSSVIERIERTYGVDVRLLCPELADDALSGAFYREDISGVMQTLSQQYGFSYTIKKDSVTIY